MAKRDLCIFFYNDLELAHMAVGQVQDTPLGQTQSECEEGTANVSL